MSDLEEYPGIRLVRIAHRLTLFADASAEFLEWAEEQEFAQILERLANDQRQAAIETKLFSIPKLQEEIEDLKKDGLLERKELTSAIDRIVGAINNLNQTKTPNKNKSGVRDEIK